MPGAAKLVLLERPVSYVFQHRPRAHGGAWLQLQVLPAPCEKKINMEGSIKLVKAFCFVLFIGAR